MLFMLLVTFPIPSLGVGATGRSPLPARSARGRPPSRVGAWHVPVEEPTPPLRGTKGMGGGKRVLQGGNYI